MGQKSPSEIVQLWQTAAQNKDANTMASFYASDAVLCATPEGIIQGQGNIKTDFQQAFSNGWTLSGIEGAVNNVQANWAWSYGKWNGALGTTNLTGTWSLVWVLQGGNWMIQQQSIVTDIPQ